MGTSSPFLNLPSELRNEIYEFYAADLTIKVHHGVASVPALAQTCRKIRTELMSTLHRCLFHTAPIEITVVDWDFEPVLKFLNRLKAHQNGHTRQLKIFIDVMTRAANYSPQRVEWCKNARFALGWYLEIPRRQVGLDDESKLLRMKINEQFFDVTYSVRFPASPFSVKERFPSELGYSIFVSTYFRRAAYRVKFLSVWLENALVRAARSRLLIQQYWLNYAAWITILENRRAQARVSRYDEVMKLYGSTVAKELYIAQISKSKPLVPQGILQHLLSFGQQPRDP